MTTTVLPPEDVPCFGSQTPLRVNSAAGRTSKVVANLALGGTKGLLSIIAAKLMVPTSIAILILIFVPPVVGLDRMLVLKWSWQLLSRALIGTG